MMLIYKFRWRCLFARLPAEQEPHLPDRFFVQLHRASPEACSPATSTRSPSPWSSQPSRPLQDCRSLQTARVGPIETPLRPCRRRRPAQLRQLRRHWLQHSQPWRCSPDEAGGFVGCSIPRPRCVRARLALRSRPSFVRNRAEEPRALAFDPERRSISTCSVILLSEKCSGLFFALQT